MARQKRRKVVDPGFDLFVELTSDPGVVAIDVFAVDDDARGDEPHVIGEGRVHVAREVDGKGRLVWRVRMDEEASALRETLLAATGQPKDWDMLVDCLRAEAEKVAGEASGTG